MWVTGGRGKVASLGPLVSELAGLCCSRTDYRGLPEDFPKVCYHLDHITMTFSGTNLIFSANPGYQASHRSFRSNTLWVWLQYLSLLPKKSAPFFFSVKYWKHPLKLSLFFPPRESETFICPCCPNVSPGSELLNEYISNYSYKYERFFFLVIFTPKDPDIVNT